jgi:predicted nucleic acid-binding protein
MILLDSAVWVDHLRQPDPAVSNLLRAEEIVMHSAVLGEVLLGNFRDRGAVFRALSQLPTIESAPDSDVIRLIELHHLFGSGVGFVDVHLLAACLLNQATYLWTTDRRLMDAAKRLGVDATSP